MKLVIGMAWNGEPGGLVQTGHLQVDALAKAILQAGFGSVIISAEASTQDEAASLEAAISASSSGIKVEIVPLQLDGTKVRDVALADAFAGTFPRADSTGPGSLFALTNLGDAPGCLSFRKGVLRHAPAARPVEVWAFLRAEGYFLSAKGASPKDADKFLAHPPALRTKAPGMLKTAEDVRSAAAKDYPVLLTGETGTGKDLVANVIRATGARRDKPFVAVSCAEIPKDLVESALFGHTKGSFTGATADRQGFFREASGGTLFLDEIGELSLDIQAKLLRVLDNQEVRPIGGKVCNVDTRLIAATNQDLEAMVKNGTFREELLGRLDRLAIHVPPLRDRKEDLDVILANLVESMFDARGQAFVVLPDALTVLEAHTWPKNVRELRATLERIDTFARGVCDATGARSAIRLARAAPAGTGRTFSLAIGDLFSDGLKADEILQHATDSVQREVIGEAMRRSGQKQSDAAKLLGVTPGALSQKMKKLGMKPGEPG